MKLYLLYTFAAFLVLAPAAHSAVSADNPDSYIGQGISLQMTRTEGSVLNPGDEIGFRVQADQDGYLVVFNIDTEGFVNLLYPARGERPVTVREGETYLIPDDSRELLLVEGVTGVEFVFALIVPERGDIIRQQLDFMGKANDLPREDRYRIEGDPFIAANIVAGELVRGISQREGVFLDYTYFFINERVAYPCYMCGECEGQVPDPACADYIIASNFDQDGPFRYPLQRGYEMIEPAMMPATEDDLASGGLPDDRTFGQYQSDDGSVNINFYPYNSEVYYETRETFAGGTDVNIYLNQWDPYWYDPWYSGWYYYPRPYVGFYWGYPSYWWGFNWGYWGGYYCSSWYWPRCYYVYDCYRYNYCYYDGGYRYKPARYKDKYYGGDLADGRTGYKDKRARPEPYQTAYTQSAKRDGSLRVASSNLTRSRGSATTRAKSRSSYTNTASRTRGESYNKTTRVIKSRPGTTGSASASRGYAAKSTRSYTPRTRGSYGGQATTRSGYTGTRNKTTERLGVRSRSTTSGKSTYRPVTRRSSMRHGNSKSTYQKSRTAPNSYRSGSSKSRTSKSTYKPPSRSSSGRSSSKSTIKRSGGSSRSSSRSAVKSSGRSSSGSKSRSSGRTSSGGRSRSGGKGRR
jgi:hypothetical protein